MLVFGSFNILLIFQYRSGVSLAIKFSLLKSVDVCVSFRFITFESFTISIRYHHVTTGGNFLYRDRAFELFVDNCLSQLPVSLFRCESTCPVSFRIRGPLSVLLLVQPCQVKHGQYKWGLGRQAQGSKKWGWGSLFDLMIRYRYKIEIDKLDPYM